MADVSGFPPSSSSSPQPPPLPMPPQGPMYSSQWPSQRRVRQTSPMQPPPSRQPPDNSRMPVPLAASQQTFPPPSAAAVSVDAAASAVQLVPAAHASAPAVRRAEIAQDPEGADALTAAALQARRDSHAQASTSAPATASRQRSKGSTGKSAEASTARGDIQQQLRQTGPPCMFFFDVETSGE